MNPSEQYYEVFSFGNSPEMADELLALVLAGKKTATVSVLLDGEKPPKPGDLSLVLDGRGKEACVIRTRSVKLLPFSHLTWDMVRLEGEDESYETWLEGNLRYWKRDAEERAYSFTESTPVVFEEFELVRLMGTSKNSFNFSRCPL